MIEDLFYQQEILFENIFIDGTKIEANANRYTFVWKKTIHKNEGKMFDKIFTLVENINIEELRNFIVQKETLIDDINKILKWLLYEKRSFKNDISKRENMKYDAESYLYICHNGRKLIPTSIIHRKSASGYKSEATTLTNCIQKYKMKELKSISMN